MIVTVMAHNLENSNNGSPYTLTIRILFNLHENKKIAPNWN